MNKICLKGLGLIFLISGLAMALPESEPEVVWAQDLIALEHQSARALALDKDGNIYIGGNTCLDGPSDGYLLARYDSDGNLLLSKAFKRFGSYRYCCGVGVDNQNNIFLSGTVTTHTDDGVTYMLDPNGNQKWESIYTPVSTEWISGFAVDDNGYSYMTGYIHTMENGYDGRLTVKQDPSGEVVWFDVCDEGTAYGIDVDNEGCVYVGGRAKNEEQTETLIRILKYDPDGNLIFTTDYDIPGKNDRCADIVVDDDGFIYITGKSGPRKNDALVTAKFDPQRNLLWDNIYDSGIEERINDITLDQGGFSYVTGYLQDSSTPDTTHHIHTIKYSPEGEILWQKTYVKEGFWTFSSGVGVDDCGCVYVGGYSYNTTNGNDLLTIKYKQFLTISGKVSGESGSGLEGVEVRLSGAETESVTTDESGYYQFTGLPCGQDYVVTPDNDAFSFYPSSRNYSPLGYTYTDQNFQEGVGINEDEKIIDPIDLDIEYSGNEVLVKYTLKPSVNARIFNF